MRKQSTPKITESSPTLETWLRAHGQQFIQHVLEEEVTDWLGWQKSVRRRGFGQTAGYQNGYDKPRRLTLSCGTITVRRPRVRECDERLVSRLFPFFKRKSVAVDHLLPELYLQGLENVDGRRTDLPSGEASRVDGRHVSREEIYRWKTTKNRRRRLILFPHYLTEPLFSPKVNDNFFESIPKLVEILPDSHVDVRLPSTRWPY